MQFEPIQGIDGNKTRLVKTPLPDGSIDIAYTEEDGSPLLALEIKTRRAKAQSDFQLIIKDLELVVSSLTVAKSFAEKIESEVREGEVRGFNHHDTEDQSHIIMWSLFTSSIITYGKCYAGSKVRHAKIPQSKLYAQLGDDFKKVHEKIIDYRNQWVAHGGENKNEISKTVLLLDPRRRKFPAVTYHTSFKPWDSPEEICEFLDLSKAVLAFARDYTVLKGSSFFEEEIINGKPEEFYRHAGPSVRFEFG